MPYIKKHRKALKKKISTFFVFVVPLFLISSSFILIVLFSFWGELFMSTPIVFAAAQDQKSFSKNNPLEVLVLPLLKVGTSEKDVNQKVVVVVHRAVQKISEAHLKIPRIGVDAVIKDMGLTFDGAMAVPGNSIEVGWFSLGTRPGDIGSAVIGGHNNWDSKAGVFADLNQLQKGDVLSVVDAKGVSVSFVVRDIRTYDATDTNTGIFDSKSGVHLNLITCSGGWDPLTKSATKRLVIFTDMVQATNENAMVPIPSL